jgi:hypothetical protein
MNTRRKQERQTGAQALPENSKRLLLQKECVDNKSHLHVSSYLLSIISAIQAAGEDTMPYLSRAA